MPLQNRYAYFLIFPIFFKKIKYFPHTPYNKWGV